MTMRMPKQSSHSFASISKGEGTRHPCMRIIPYHLFLFVQVQQLPQFPPVLLEL